MLGGRASLDWGCLAMLGLIRDGRGALLLAFLLVLSGFGRTSSRLGSLTRGGSRGLGGLGLMRGSVGLLVRCE